tara:strand:+ start:5008 stop:7569 length:2562 start_codon:yes stop_codon:yes gene_type:complete
MDYFNELLESYSRLKKRKLVLLEQEPSAKEKKAEQDAGGREKAEAFFNAADNERVVANLQAMDAKKAPYAYKGDFKGRLVTKITGGPLGNRTINGATFQEMESTYPEQTTKLVNYFADNQEPDEITSMLQGVGLEAALNRVGNQLEDAAPGMEAGILESIKGKLLTSLQKANSLVLVARELGVKENWAGWSKETESYRGQAEGDDSPDKTGTVGSYISGGAPQSLERQMAQGKLGMITEEEGLVLQDMVSDPTLIQGAVDSMNALLSFGDSEIEDKDEKCASLGSRVRSKGKKLVLHNRGNMDEGVVISRNQFLEFAIKQARERCDNPGVIPEIPKGIYTPQELNDARGKGLETAFVAVSFYDSLRSLDDSTKKKKLLKDFAKYVTQELLLDQRKFDAANRWAVETERNKNATDLRGSFVSDMLLELGKQTNTPAKLIGFLQRAHEMEAVVVNKIKPEFSIPLGKKTGAGIADDMGYLYRDEKSAQNAANELGLERGETVLTTTVEELKKESPEMAELYQERYDLSDDQQVYVVGSGVKSYFDEGSVKAGENNSYERRSGLVNGTDTQSVAEGFQEVTMKRLGFNDADLSDVRSYQAELDNIYDTMGSILPEDSTVLVDAEGNRRPIDFKTTVEILDTRIAGLSLDDAARNRLKMLVQNQDGTKINLSDKIERLDLRENLGRLLLNAKQSNDCKERDSSGQLTEKAMRARKNLAYTCHMIGGVKLDSAMNRKTLNSNNVRVGSHMAPINEATKGILDPDSGFEVDIASTGNTLSLRRQGVGGISLGTERTRGADRVPRTRSLVSVSSESQKDSATINETISVRQKGSENVQDSLMINFLRGQAKLLEQLLANS